MQQAYDNGHKNTPNNRLKIHKKIGHMWIMSLIPKLPTVGLADCNAVIWLHDNWSTDK